MLWQEEAMMFLGWLGWFACSSVPSVDFDSWDVSEGLGLPPGDLALEIEGSLMPGEWASLEARGAQAYEQIYVVSTRSGVGDGLCHPRLGGGCLGLNSPILLAGSMWSDLEGDASLSVRVEEPVGSERCFQPIVLRGPGGSYTEIGAPACGVVCAEDTDGDGICDEDEPVWDGEADIPDWVLFDFVDNGHRDDCVGGDKYVISSVRPGSEHMYLGATLCDDRLYKLWLSDDLEGMFYAMGDWSGYGQDHCNHMPGGSEVSITWDSVAQTDWEGWEGGGDMDVMTFKFFASNAWVPFDYDCGVSIP
jgi:hypothetical protein